MKSISLCRVHFTICLLRGRLFFPTLTLTLTWLMLWLELRQGYDIVVLANHIYQVTRLTGRSELPTHYLRSDNHPQRQSESSNATKPNKVSSTNDTQQKHKHKHMQKMESKTTCGIRGLIFTKDKSKDVQLRVYGWAIRRKGRKKKCVGGISFSLSPSLPE